MIIETLRNSTKTTHLELDHMLYPHIQGIHSDEQYIKLLELFYGYLKPLQNRINKYLNDDLVTDYSRRRKPERILDDIDSIAKKEGEITYCCNLPEITNSAEAFGAYYVIEGSSMGGAIIKKTIAKNWESCNATAFSFFAAYEGENRSMWNSFLLSLELEPSNHLHFDLLINCAQNTFIKFKNWLQAYYGGN